MYSCRVRHVAVLMSSCFGRCIGSNQMLISSMIITELFIVWYAALITTIKPQDEFFVKNSDSQPHHWTPQLSTLMLTPRPHLRHTNQGRRRPARDH